MRNFGSRRFLSKALPLALVCVVCFFVGLKATPYLEIFLPGYIVEFVRFGSFSASNSKSSSADRDAFAVEVTADPVIYTAQKMNAEVISQLGHNFNALIEWNKPYLDMRKKIRADYALGKRDAATLRSFSYLNSLEWNWEDMKKATKEFCADTVLCERATAEVSLSGIIMDDTGKPVSGAKISAYGEEQSPAISAQDGSYTLSFDMVWPRKLRFQVVHPNYALGVHTVDLIDPLYAVSKTQSFTKNFTLRSIYQEIFIDTKKKTITGNGSSVVKEGYQIINPFTKYLIPFNAIVGDDGKPFLGKVRAAVYEFDRTTANELLSSDVFTEASGYAAQWLITYGMPLIFFYDSTGRRLEVYRKFPMQIWTMNRELEALVQDNAIGKHSPWFNPAQYEEASSPENVAKFILQDEEKAYLESQKDKNAYPITFEWTLKNESRLPGFWVYDQFSWFWENAGYSLVEKATHLPYSIHAPFWTKK